MVMRSSISSGGCLRKFFSKSLAVAGKGKTGLSAHVAGPSSLAAERRQGEERLANVSAPLAD